MNIKCLYKFIKFSYFRSRLFSTESVEIVKYSPLTPENWMEKCVFYSKNYNLRKSNPNFGISMREDIKNLINLDFTNKKRALIHFCDHLSKWNLCDIKTCALIREEVDKQSINPIESRMFYDNIEGLFHTYLHGAKNLKNKKRNVRLCKILLNKLYKYQHFTNFDQLIDYLLIIGRYYKPDLSAKRRIGSLIISMQRTHHQYDAPKLAIACSRLGLESEKIYEYLNMKNFNKTTLLPFNKLSRSLDKWISSKNKKLICD